MLEDLQVIKRDGSRQDFSITKIADSVWAAAETVGGDCYELSEDIAETVADRIDELTDEADMNEISVELIQTLVQKELIEEGHAKTATCYILKSAERMRAREEDSPMMKAIKEATFTDSGDSEMKRENANIDSETAMGTMLKYGSEAAKLFNISNMMSEEYSELHSNGDIHAHDLDFYTLTETCAQIDILALLKNGFNTGHGFLREPGNIRTAGALAAIIIQSNQNDQHGGQAIPMFDFYLAPYVALTFTKRVGDAAKKCMRLTKEQRSEIVNEIKNFRETTERKLLLNKAGLGAVEAILQDKLTEFEVSFNEEDIRYIMNEANDDTYDETYQSMEAFIHNLNTMHSRAGSQVPFSSINYGTDTSTEGRMIMRALLENTDAGLGNGEIPIFPIQIWKMKAGVSINPGDPNYDLFRLACKVSAKRLYPNWCNLDAPYNAAIYVEGKPETEMAYMGCRTRISTNLHDLNQEILPGRGNLSFTSINLPRIAIMADKDISKFFSILDKRLESVHHQLLERFEIQCRKHPRNYPFLMGQHVWLGSEQLGPDDDMREILKHGTLGIGFIGLAETLIALTGKHHGESEESQKLGLKIISHMREYADLWSEEEHMNYGILATPAEGLSGRFVKKDKELFGYIKGVTDKLYYTNSFHVPVYYHISAMDKIDIEAPYHELCNGGHITYIELDGDPLKNLAAFEKVVHYMHDAGIGYGAINHPVDRDPVCRYVGIIDDVCPRCGRKDGEPMTIEMWQKINGYANVANADTIGACGNPEEEADRITNDI